MFSLCSVMWIKVDFKRFCPFKMCGCCPTGDEQLGFRLSPWQRLLLVNAAILNY